MQDGPIDVENLILQVRQLKQANTDLSKKLRRERQENERLRKVLNPDRKQYYRNSRKKSDYGVR